MLTLEPLSIIIAISQRCTSLCELSLRHSPLNPSGLLQPSLELGWLLTLLPPALPAASSLEVPLAEGLLEPPVPTATLAPTSLLFCHNTDLWYNHSRIRIDLSHVSLPIQKLQEDGDWLYFLARAWHAVGSQFVE